MPSQNRLKKEQQVAEFNDTFSKTSAAIVSVCSGVTVESITKFRSSLREQDAGFKVLKNSVAQRAVEGTSMEALKDDFVGQTAIAFTDGDPVALAKILADFSKEQENFSIKSGVLDGNYLDENKVKELANIPSKEVLISKMLGSLQAPYSGLVCSLSGILRKLVYALEAIRREKEQKGE